MLILIENEAKSYAWGSTVALPELLGFSPTGEPQAELWLGTHPGSPSRLAKSARVGHTLIDLIEGDPCSYGVDGQHLPFLLKVLAIESPLSLQVHPTGEQAAQGFEAENLRGIPILDPKRNYRDLNHKPELLVALNDVIALCGFRSIESSYRDILAILQDIPEGAANDALSYAASLCASSQAASRKRLLLWALAPGSSAIIAVQAVEHWLAAGSRLNAGIDPVRLAALEAMVSFFPGDPGIIISLFLHVVRLQRGEAIFLKAGDLHAYLSGMAIEVMASSDNVLRGGLTEKNIDTDEFCRLVRLDELVEPRVKHETLSPGLVSWDPDVEDFRLLRATLSRSDGECFAGIPSSVVTVPAPYPLTMIVTEGGVRVERPEAGVTEIVNLVRGQSLYVSAGQDVSLSGDGEVFVATVGRNWKSKESELGQSPSARVLQKCG